MLLHGSLFFLPEVGRRNSYEDGGKIELIFTTIGFYGTISWMQLRKAKEKDIIAKKLA